MKKLLAVDGNSILNRAYYGIRPLTTNDGLYTHAVYGLVNIINSHVEHLRPDYRVVAFDMKAPTFRHKMYDAYKANRKGMPEELAMQLPYAKKALKYMGFTVLEKEGWEADDILGTLSAIAEENNAEAYILTGDRDSLQLVSENTCVLLATTGETVLYDERKFFEKYGTTPPHLVDIKALMGDSSDNIPGVSGIGEKSALKLISQYGSLDGVYDELEQKPLGKSVMSKLIAGKDNAYMSYELARIDKNVPISRTIDDYEYNGIDEKELFKLFKYLQFGALIKKFGLNEEKEKLSVPTFCETSITAIDKNKCYSIFDDDEKVYLYDGKNGFKLDAEQKNIAYGELKLICENSKRIFACNDNANIVFDVTLAGYVLDSSSSDYSLSHLALSYLGSGEPKNAEEKTACIYELYEKLNESLKEQKTDVLYYNVELPLSAVLADMEKCGFKVDTHGLEEFGKTLDENVNVLTERIYAMCGGEFNINSPKQLGEVLFEQLGLPARKKTKTGYSTNAEVLEELRPYHPVIDEILEYRNLTKLKSTYVDGLLKAADENGIVRTSFNQTVTATGRLSSTEPNLQNIPVRTEQGKILRKYFVPKKDGCVLIDSDYSQIELRLLAAISGDESMINAFEKGADIHTETASQVFGVPAESVTPEMRKKAKAVSFGIVYGISDFSLAKDIGTSRAAAKKYIESYLNKYPGVSEYLENIKKEGRQNGYVKTLLGRRRYIPELSSSKKNIQAFGERVAMNSPIQGTAADIIKIAMINTHKALVEHGYDAHLILQVHDELMIEARKEDSQAVMRLLQTEMENAIELPIKLSVEISCADNWYDCK